MSITIKQAAIPLWHYHCPECGVGDADTGYRAQTHAIYCEVCLEDGRQVRLRRWPVDDEPKSLSGGVLR